MHVAAFFFISIDNTLPELRHGVRTEVTLDNAAGGTAEAPEEAYFDMLNDPRLYVLPQPSAAFAGARPIRSRPIELHPVAMPAPAEIGSFPFLNQPLPTLAQRVEQSAAAGAPAVSPTRKTRRPSPISPPGSGARRWPTARPLGCPPCRRRFPTRRSRPPGCASRIAPDGTVSDVMLDQSSQQPDLDQQAILAARKVRFQPTDQPGLAWGEVTIAWYYTPKPQEVAPPLGAARAMRLSLAHFFDLYVTVCLAVLLLSWLVFLRTRRRSQMDARRFFICGYCQSFLSRAEAVSAAPLSAVRGGL